MADFNDWYKETTLNLGNECSRILADLIAPTLQEHPDVVFVKSGMNHVAVLAPRKNNIYYAFSVGGPSDEKDMQMYVKKLIEKGINTALDSGLIPIGFADVIDASRSDTELARLIGNVMVEECHKSAKRLFTHKLAVFNGEYADLSERVTVDANMNITMICCVEDNDYKRMPENKIFKYYNSGSIVGFNPGKNFIYVNSDGVGTKHILYELAGQEHLSVIDSMAMKLDDLVKINAKAIIVSDVLEHNDLLSYKKQAEFENLAAKLMSNHGIGMISSHNVGDRLKAYKPGMVACNLSGSSVSLISEDRLKNLPIPKEGNYLLSIRKASESSPNQLGPDGPRSNGIGLLRRIPRDKYGDNWYNTPEGQEILKFATTPSDIFYPLFKQVLDEDVASAVFHMSGGSYNEKLARPLAKEGLHADLKNLWPVSDDVKRIIAISGMPPSSFYNKWPVSNPGFIATDYPAAVDDIARQHGYLVRPVARLEKSDKPGVSLKTYMGDDIYFNGN